LTKLLFNFFGLCVLVPIAVVMSTSTHLLAWVVDILFIPEQLLDLLNSVPEEKEETPGE
jgi:hypothetical protein